MREITQLTQFFLVLRHGTHDATNSGVTLVVQLAMRHTKHIVEEIPHIALRPLKDRRNKDRVLAVDATHLVVLLQGKFVLVDLLAFALHLAHQLLLLLGNLLLLPFEELLKVARKLLVRHFDLVTFGAS